MRCGSSKSTWDESEAERAKSFSWINFHLVNICLIFISSFRRKECEKHLRLPRKVSLLFGDKFWCFFVFGCCAKGKRGLSQIYTIFLFFLFCRTLLYWSNGLNKYFLLKSCPKPFFTRPAFREKVKGERLGLHHAIKTPEPFSTQLTVTSNEKLFYASPSVRICSALLVFPGAKSKICWSIPRHFQQNKHKKWINCAFLRSRFQRSESDTTTKRNSRLRDFALRDKRKW